MAQPGFLKKWLLRPVRGRNWNCPSGNRHGRPAAPRPARALEEGGDKDMFLEKKQSFREDGLLKNHTRIPNPTPAVPGAVRFFKQKPARRSQAPTSPSLRATPA